MQCNEVYNNSVDNSTWKVQLTTVHNSTWKIQNTTVPGKFSTPQYLESQELHIPDSL